MHVAVAHLGAHPGVLALTAGVDPCRLDPEPHDEGRELLGEHRDFTRSGLGLGRTRSAGLGDLGDRVDVAVDLIRPGGCLGDRAGDLVRRRCLLPVGRGDGRLQVVDRATISEMRSIACTVASSSPLTAPSSTRSTHSRRTSVQFFGGTA